MGSAFMTNLVVWYVVFLFSTTFHEAMHAFVSHRFGDSTAYQGGQVTLNPVPHIRRSPVGMVVMPLVTFFLNHGNWMIGWASAPFNPYWAARYPRRSFLMSLAGPLSHLPLVLISVFCMWFGLRNGFFHDPFTAALKSGNFPDIDFGANSFPVAAAAGSTLSWALATLLNVVFQLNTVLLVFNLMPVPPLDGSEVWYLFVRKEEDRLRLRYQAGSYQFVGLLFSWWLFNKIYGPVLLFIIDRFLYRLPFAY